MNKNNCIIKEMNNKQRASKLSQSHFRLFSAFIFVFALLFSSCASRLPQENLPAEQILSWFMDMDSKGLAADKNIYVIIPLESNEPLFMDIATKYVEPDTLDRFIKRTTTVYGAISPFNADVSFAAHGVFPKSFSSIIFPKSKGWQNTSFESSLPLSKAYTTYYEADAGITTIQTAIPTSNLLFASFNNIETILERAGSGYVGYTIEEPVKSILNSKPQSVRFYIPNPQEYTRLILGNVMTLPIEQAAGQLTPVYNANNELIAYSTNITIKINNPRLVTTTVMLMNSLFFGSSDDLVISSEGSYIIIENMMLSLENISQLL